MKTLFLTLFIFCTAASYASTSITSTSVSGHWTIAGSPYLIYNNIQVNSLSGLTIDPGVEVIFQGYYKMNVYGSLIAAGTATQ